MIITAHLLAGAAIASRISNPILGLPLAFLSHFLLDAIPHREYANLCKDLPGESGRKTSTIFLKIIIDFLTGFSILLFFLKDISGENAIFAMVGGLLAISPDFDNLSLLLPNLLKIRPFKLFYDFHQATHFWAKKEIPLFWGIFSQVLIILAAIFLLK